MPGLYDGDFVGFRVPSAAELDAALRDAIVGVDANVLLNLYRYRPQTARDLVKVLESLGDRLVVPHQALREFWRHRQRSAASPQAANDEVTAAIAKAERSLSESLGTWAKKLGVDADELATITEQVSTFVGSLSDALESAFEEAGSRSVEEDTILADLERILEGRVTEALPEAEWEQCLEEARRRIEAEDPRGYRDAAKEEGGSPEGGGGDYLVWYQATRYAKEADRDLVVVTADEKEDWWWRQRAVLIGPRPELSLEYHNLSGRRLFMLRPADLLSRAGVLQVEVDETSAADADRPTSDDANDTQWTADALEALLVRLEREAPVQAAALRAAGSTPRGIVTRDQVYELGSFDDDRMLRGFTRPYRRLTEALQDTGLIPLGVPPVLVARYPDGVKASYFSTPPEVPVILGATLAELEDPPPEGASSQLSES